MAGVWIAELKTVATDGLKLLVAVDYWPQGAVGVGKPLHSETIVADPANTNVNIRDLVISEGTKARAAQDRRDTLLGQFPAGSQLTVP